MSTELTFPIDAEKVVPHRLPMRFIESLVDAGDDHAVALATPGEDHPMARPDGEIDELCLLEMMAQTLAGMQGYTELKSGGPPKEGYLVGVRSLKVHKKARVGQTYRVEVRLTGSIEGFQLADAGVYLGDEVLATSTVRVWLKDA